MKNFLKDNLWKIIIAIAIFGFAYLAVNSCQRAKQADEQQKHNIEALTDSIHYWETKAGQAVAEKKILIGDLDLLKVANDSLYNKVKELELKKPSSVVYIKTEVINEKHDTLWKYVTDSTFHKEEFDFSDQWRLLAGNVQWNDSTMRMSIDKDVVLLDYIIAVQNGKAVVSSSNPYVKMTEISGIEMPKPKAKKFHIGPYAGYGIGFYDGKVIGTPEIGIGLSYSIISF